MHLCALQGTEQLGGTTLISLYDSLFYPLTPDLRCIHHTGSRAGWVRAFVRNFHLLFLSLQRAPGLLFPFLAFLMYLCRIMESMSFVIVNSTTDCVVCQHGYFPDA